MKATKCVLASVRAERERERVWVCARERAYVCSLQTVTQWTKDRPFLIFRGYRHFVHKNTKPPAISYILLCDTSTMREKKEEKKTSPTAKWPGTKKNIQKTHTPHTLYRWLTMSKFGDYSFEMTSEHRHNFGVSRNLEKWASSFCLTIVRTNTHTDILVAAYNLLPVKQWKTQTKLLIRRYEIISNRMGLTCHTTVTLFFYCGSSKHKNCHGNARLKNRGRERGGARERERKRKNLAQYIIGITWMFLLQWNRIHLKYELLSIPDYQVDSINRHSFFSLPYIKNVLKSLRMSKTFLQFGLNGFVKREYYSGKYGFYEVINSYLFNEKKNQPWTWFWLSGVWRFFWWPQNVQSEQPILHWGIKSETATQWPWIFIFRQWMSTFQLQKISHYLSDLR